jgi:hypothetical protein
MKTEQWVKIGETVKSASMLRLGLYAKYAVMEFIKENGDRKYKEVLIATWSESVDIKAQPQL